MDKNKIINLIAQQEMYIAELKEIAEQSAPEDIVALQQEVTALNERLQQQVEQQQLLAETLAHHKEQNEHYRQALRHKLFMQREQAATERLHDLGRLISGAPADNVARLERLERRIKHEATGMQAEIAERIDQYDVELQAQLEAVKEDMRLAREVFQRQIAQ